MIGLLTAAVATLVLPAAGQYAELITEAEDDPAAVTTAVGTAAALDNDRFTVASGRRVTTRLLS